MKLCFYTDCHWSQNSSIVRSRGAKYSTRLENLISSMNWVEELATNCGCSWIVCGGDFFDSTVLNAEELSALKEIQWAPMTHIFLTGNHETNVSSLEFAASDVFNLCPNAVVISQPECNVAYGTDTEFAFLPYILERDRKPISEYFGPRTAHKRILFSHNDIKDVQYGAFLSTEGFTIDDIHANSDLCLNGHIHHCGYVAERILNGGNLTGQNFTEDAFKFEHCAMIVDTETLVVTPYRNPYAFNFAKIDATGDKFVRAFPIPFPNAVVTVRVTGTVNARAAREALDFADNIIAYRLVVENETSSEPEMTQSFETVDHLTQFKQFVLENIGDTNIIREELNNVMGG